VASVLLLWLSLRTTFLLAAVPSAIALALVVFALREDAPALHDKKAWPLKDWRQLGGRLSVLLGAIFFFTLGNSTDAFLLIRLSDAGLEVKWIALLWSVHHIVRMVCNYYGGRLSDRWGAKPMIVAGWLVYAAVYFAFGRFASLQATIALFMVYGIYYGLTEPSEKALVSLFAPKELRATAFGY
jgi:MFS family permease